MRKLIVIYGAPRSSTTFMLSCLVKHNQCAGTDPDNPNRERGQMATNENPQLDETKLNELWKFYVHRGEEYLAVKAPGYCSQFQFFNKLKEFECKYIFCYRKPLEAAWSSVHHPHSQQVFGFEDIESTSCPEYLRGELRQPWKNCNAIAYNKARMLNRGLIRHFWHITSIHPEMKRQSLTVFSTYYQQPSHLLMSYLGLESDGLFEGALAMYDRKPMEEFQREACMHMVLPNIAELFGYDL